MRHIYANLLGNWTDITDAGTVENGQNPGEYFKDHLAYADGSTVPECFKYGYVLVEYGSRQYRLDSAHFQFVDE